VVTDDVKVRALTECLFAAGLLAIVLLFFLLEALERIEFLRRERTPVIAGLINVRPAVAGVDREYLAELDADATRTVTLLSIDYPAHLWPPRNGDRVLVPERPEVSLVERPAASHLEPWRYAT
jgi:hypothetical protein